MDLCFRSMPEEIHIYFSRWLDWRGTASCLVTMALSYGGIWILKGQVHAILIAMACTFIVDFDRPVMSTERWGVGVFSSVVAALCPNSGLPLVCIFWGQVRCRFTGNLCSYILIAYDHLVVSCCSVLLTEQMRWWWNFPCLQGFGRVFNHSFPACVFVGGD